MTTMLFFVVALLETAVIGGLFLLYPRFARRGLLFGVYVGERTSDGPEARAITASWYRAMFAWLGASLVLATLLAQVVPRPPVIGFFPLVLVAGPVALYIRAYRQAQRFAIAPSAPSIAFLGAVPEPSLKYPITALVAGLAGGIFSIVYTVAAYPQLPARIPTHFGFTGAPDAWHAKHWSSVVIPAVLDLVVGAGLGGVAILTARAKRAVRHSVTTLGIGAPPAEQTDTEVSLQAQLLFRRANARLLSTIALLITAAMTWLNVGSIRVGLGLADRLPWPAMAFMGAVVAVAIGGSLYIGLRYGQGGSRLERRVANAPLTNGLADNRYWVLGAFYVNRDDPSFMVEDRFGLGYTLNFGNRKAVAAFGGFLAIIIGLAIAAAVFI